MPDSVTPPTDAGPPSAASAERGATVWRHAEHTAYVESPERVVVLDLDHLDRSPYVFEGSAAVIWTCLDGDRTESEVVSDVAEAYEVEAEVVAPDVKQFVDRLRGLGLVVADVV